MSRKILSLMLLMLSVVPFVPNIEADILFYDTFTFKDGSTDGRTVIVRAPGEIVVNKTVLYEIYMGTHIAADGSIRLRDEISDKLPIRAVVVALGVPEEGIVIQYDNIKVHYLESGDVPWSSSANAPQTIEELEPYFKPWRLTLDEKNGELLISKASELLVGLIPSSSVVSSVSDVYQSWNRDQHNSAFRALDMNEYDVVFVSWSKGPRLTQDPVYEVKIIIPVTYTSPPRKDIPFYARILQAGLVPDSDFVTGTANILDQRDDRIPMTEAKRQTTQTSTKVGRDGAPMVLIPAGEFQMGSNDGSDDEKPVHTVYLDAFYMDKYEVTNALYKKFMDATEHKAPDYWSDPKYNTPNQPVVGVSWHDAVAYAEWAGKRLPTEAEWEKAARGGLSGKKYPWGDLITHDDANYEGTAGRDRWQDTAPVGSFAPNGYGLYDMAGNVFEWCLDWHGSNYYSSSPKNNPKGPSSGEYRVIRDGGWYDNPNGLRVAVRFYSPQVRTFYGLGFRCGADFSP